LAGCGGNEHADLREFIDEAKSKPKGVIEPLPTFNLYESFTYSAVSLWSPFEKPLTASADNSGGGKSAVEPDESRQKEYLEGFGFSSFTLVGSIKKDGTLWSLVNDGEGGVHRVKPGNYLGKNHGKIVAVDETKLNLIEIVPDGKSGWVERPRTLAFGEND
jgi:type IV pilus assembly protein PilP